MNKYNTSIESILGAIFLGVWLGLLIAAVYVVGAILENAA